MRRLGAALSVVLAATIAAPVADAAVGRIRRPKVPPPPAPALPTGLAVDEFEFYLRPSQLVVAAGTVRIRVYNRGMDDHNLVLVTKEGEEHRIDLKAGGNGTLTPRLSPGRYELYCDLFSGTAESHYDKGMRVEITVR